MIDSPVGGSTPDYHNSYAKKTNSIARPPNVVTQYDEGFSL